MGWLSHLGDFLSPLLSFDVIASYCGLITYKYYRDGPPPYAMYAVYIVEITAYLLLTTIIAVLVMVVLGDVALPGLNREVFRFTLPSVFAFSTMTMAVRTGESPGASSLRCAFMLGAFVISLALTKLSSGDNAAMEVKAVADGTILWTILAATRLYVSTNLKVRNLALPVAFLTLLAAAPLIAYQDKMGHISAVIGLVLAAVATLLAFTFGNATPLQRQIILTLAALAGGAISTEIPGFLNLDLSLGEKSTIAAGGALAVFVILYFWSARAPRA